MLLFVDTESDIVTKEPISIQLKYGKYTEIIKNFQYLERLDALWEACEAVIMFNAPYDLGVLSSLKGNAYSIIMKRGNWRFAVISTALRE